MYRASTRAVSILCTSIFLALGAVPAQADNDSGGPRGARAFSKAIKDARRTLFGAPWYDRSQRGPAERHLQHLVRLATAEGFAIADPLYPEFRNLSEHTTFGLANPDVAYYSARIATPGEYVIRGRRGTSADLQIQVGEGTPGVDGINMIPISQLTSEDLVVDADGYFEIAISEAPAGKNWMANTNGTNSATRVLVREAFSDWEKETAGTWYIERVDTKGTPSPIPTAKITRGEFERAAEYLTESAKTWVSLVTDRLSLVPENFITPPRPTPGGLPGQWSSTGSWVLAPGEAIVITVGVDPARYQGFQLADYWTNSFRFCSRQTSLTTAQAYQGTDGLIRMIITDEDPGYANWVDPSGAERFYSFIRWQGLEDGYVFPPSHVPSAVIVDVEDLETVLPADELVLSASERVEQLAARRQACLSKPRGF